MANEITSSARLAISKGNLKIDQSASVKITMNGSAVSSGSKSIPTTAAGTALPLGDVTTPGLSWIRNIDATNYIELGVNVSGTFYPFKKLMPGDLDHGRLGTTAPYARANTAAAQLFFHIAQD